LTTQPESIDPLRLDEILDLLRAEGCIYPTIFVDGQELVIDGCAPSYEAKQKIEKIVIGMAAFPVRNFIRVYPE
jgi:hypothetical protein